MPKRTNEFQRPIALLQHHLAAREGWNVQESRMLVDRVSGDEREVDIVVEGRVNGVEFVIGFECQAKKRTSDLPWVQGQCTKHERLTDKLVLVSKAPFTKSALREAALSGIDAVSFADAVNVNWSAYIDQYTRLLFATFDITLKCHSVDLQFTGGTTTLPLPDHPSVVRVGGGPAVPYLAALEGIVRQSAFARTVMDQWYALPPEERRTAYDVNFTLQPPPSEDWLMVQGSGREWRMTEIRGTVSVQTASAKLPMSSVQFLQHRMLHGAAVLPAGRRIELVLTEREGERPEATLVFGAHNGEPERVSQVEFIGPTAPRP